MVSQILLGVPLSFHLPAEWSLHKKSSSSQQSWALNEGLGFIRKDVCAGAYHVVPTVQIKEKFHAPGLAIWPSFTESKILTPGSNMKIISSKLLHFMHCTKQPYKLLILQCRFKL